MLAGAMIEVRSGETTTKLPRSSFENLGRGRGYLPTISRGSARVRYFGRRPRTEPPWSAYPMNYPITPPGISDGRPGKSTQISLNAGQSLLTKKPKQTQSSVAWLSSISSAHLIPAPARVKPQFNPLIHHLLDFTQQILTSWALFPKRPKSPPQ